jgi:hypothetical protein
MYEQRRTWMLSCPQPNHAFEGGDDEIIFTHFAPPLAADGLSRFTA